MTEQTLRHTAYHEAGHTAAQLVLGHAPSRVTIKPSTEKGSLGHASHIDGDLFSIDGLRALIINCYAGREAEIRIGGSGDGSEGDDEEAQGYLEISGLSEEAMREETKKLINEHWALVERLAQELLDRETLNGEETDILYDVYKGEATEEDLAFIRVRLREMGQID